MNIITWSLSLYFFILFDDTNYINLIKSGLSINLVRWFCLTKLDMILILHRLVSIKDTIKIVDSLRVTLSFKSFAICIQQLHVELNFCYRFCWDLRNWYPQNARYNEAQLAELIYKNYIPENHFWWISKKLNSSKTSSYMVA